MFITLSVPQLTMKHPTRHSLGTIVPLRSFAHVCARSAQGAQRDRTDAEQ
ncbi:hypothetical protein PGR6_43710 [Pseudomonas sp. GR 6-02]|nr:hypothetical protein PGR6_43710 [Pseudomonas sp. GR 6-02]